MRNIKDKPLIIALETSGRKGSVALALGGELLEQKNFSKPMKHSAELFPAIEDLLGSFDKQPTDIDEVYISVGPGSFTGLRIAITFAKAMNLANNSEIVAVDSLDVIASNIENETQYKKTAVILDAKRSQFFVAVYDHNKKIQTDSLMTSEEFNDKFLSTDEPIYLLGEGLVYYKAKFKSQGVNFIDEQYWWPQAANVHKLGRQKALNGQYEDALKLKPYYLRKPQLGKSKLLN